MYDIAARAGCSIATVSRVINGAQTIRPNISIRVKQAIAELGYVPNGSAQQMARQSTGVVGLVYRRWTASDRDDLPDAACDTRERVVVQGVQSLSYYDSLIRHVEEAAYERGYHLLIAGVSHDGPPGEVLALSGKCDGIISMNETVAGAELAQLARRVPVVTMAAGGSAEAANVAVDNRNSMRALIAHMVEVHGVSRLAFIGGPAENADAAERACAVAEYAAARGLSLDPLAHWAADFSPGAAFDLVKRRWPAGGGGPQLLLCANDLAASGAVAALSELGVRVPHDVAVTGFDDMEIARLTTPCLTTIRQPLKLIAQAAVGALFGTPAASGDIIVPGELVVRQSCGCS